jgi:hypothetical protein
MPSLGAVQNYAKLGLQAALKALGATQAIEDQSLIAIVGLAARPIGTCRFG